MLKSTGPTANQVSSLNSFVGVNAPLATSGALCGLKPNTAMKKTSPSTQRANSNKPIFLPLLIPGFFAVVSGPPGPGPCRPRSETCHAGRVP